MTPEKTANEIVAEIQEGKNYYLDTKGNISEAAILRKIRQKMTLSLFNEKDKKIREQTFALVKSKLSL